MQEAAGVPCPLLRGTNLRDRPHPPARGSMTASLHPKTGINPLGRPNKRVIFRNCLDASGDLVKGDAVLFAVSQDNQTIDLPVHQHFDSLTAKLAASVRSRAVGVPPRWTWPSITARRQTGPFFQLFE